MRELPDDGTVVGRLLAGTEGWTDATPASLPASWRSLLDLDAPSLDAETANLLASSRSGANLDVSTATTSVVADVVERHLDTMRASGSYSDVPDVVIDVTVDAVDAEPFDTELFGAGLFGADPIGEMALAAVDDLVTVDSGGASSGIVDPFFDQSGPSEQEASVDTGSDRPDEAVDEQIDVQVDELADDITGGVSGPLRSASHDPFDTLVAAPDPAPDPAPEPAPDSGRDADAPWAHDDADPIDLTEEPSTGSGLGDPDAGVGVDDGPDIPDEVDG